MLALEIRLMFAGQLGESETAATAVLINLSYVFSLISNALQITMVTLVGNLLGENQPVNAWRMVRVNIVPWSVFFFVMSILMVIFS